MILTCSYHGTTGSDVEMQFCAGKSSVSNPCAVVSVIIHPSQNLLMLTKAGKYNPCRVSTTF